MLLLNLGRYDDCIAICKELLEQNDSLADAHFYIGLAYFNQAIDLDIVEQRHMRIKSILIER